MPPCHIREATPADCSLILQYIRALASYEKLEHAVNATEDDIRASFFSQGATSHALIIEKNNAAIGFAVYFYNFSTFLGKRGIYVEDVFIAPEHRGFGAGNHLFHYLAAKAVREQCGRMEWWVLDWNTPAIDFYTRMGAVAMNEWTVYRLEGDALQRLAETNTTKDSIA